MIRLMNQPFSVSSTLHCPVRPRCFTNSVSVSHLVEFMCTWCRSAMNSLYTFLADTRLEGCLRATRHREGSAEQRVQHPVWQKTVGC